MPLEPQPLRLLTLLATRAGEVVTREAVERELWPDGISVDVEHGINTCISQIRRALGDRAARPRFVETLPRRGYRFMPSVSRGARRAIPSSPGRVFGRDDTLEKLEEDYARVASQRRGRMVCVTGEPGIGKTTVCDAFAARLRSTGDPKPYIARGRGSERLAGTEAYLPWLEVFERLIDDDPRGEVDRVMRGVAPSWFAQITSSGEAQPRLASLSQEQLKRELATFLTRLSARRPVVIWFEDLHWADASTVALIAYAGGRFDEMALLLLVTYRQTELLMARHPYTTVRLDLEGRGLSRELALPFLGPDDVRHYLDAEFPGHAFPSALPDLLHAKTEGSPLFVVDSLEHLRTRGTIVESNDGWRLAGSLPDLEQELPQSIRSVIERKLGLLEATETQLLGTAAVQGYDFDSAVVADASGVDALNAEARFAELARVHRLVTPTGERRLPDGTPTQEFRFVHVLHQNVLYAQLTPTRRFRVSLAIAHALLARHAG